MDAELDDSLLADARRGVDEGELAGAAALVWRRGRVEYAGAVGQRDLQTGQPATRDTVFRIASLSKPVTALAALRLHDEGRFALDEPISRVAPELARARVLPRPDAPLEQAALAGRAITFRDLLTHRAGLGYAELLTGPIAEAYAGLGPHIDNPAAPDEWIAALGELPVPPQVVLPIGVLEIVQLGVLVVIVGAASEQPLVLGFLPRSSLPSRHDGTPPLSC